MSRKLSYLVRVEVVKLHVGDQVLELGAVLVSEQTNADLHRREDVCDVDIPEAVLW